LAPGGPIIYQNSYNRFLGTIYKGPEEFYEKEETGFPSNYQSVGVKNVVTTIDREVVLAD